MAGGESAFGLPAGTGRRRAPRATPPLPAAAGPLALPQPDWVQTTLSVTGPADLVAAFRAAAAGAGVIPWVHDYDRMEEDWFHLFLTAPAEERPISLAGARILARQLREAVWAQHEDAVSMVGVSRACPFDLHSLVPVPFEILRLGDDDPDAIAWLWENWGTTWPLRRVEELPPAAPSPAPDADRHGFRVRFWSADWTPWQALARVQAEWPALRFTVCPIV
ncbi:conserved protein of unknown function (plasmid) [Rhodovastum atsumiense]|uniref:Uncharacterized protein n=1 Tax=Rhodovastum atsumiense TaxID=504468 RepID=A0A5M6IK21_9PROT|nr:hypothetical protein [Rhodovastum atsumiense]KAA5608616.1 hypothetical protein F1189_28260 [Rhodovastum atsumiense]CAH2605894.1 conserved protein of unknown function [Rhodovastum atsumiense]